MALQFFDDIADETHGAKLAGKCETAKSIRYLRPGREIPRRMKKPVFLSGGGRAPAGQILKTILT
jgi:hypothetical protein